MKPSEFLNKYEDMCGLPDKYSEELDKRFIDVEKLEQLKKDEIKWFDAFMGTLLLDGNVDSIDIHEMCKSWYRLKKKIEELKQ